MESVSPQMVAAAKLPVLNPGEFELWKMRIEQYFLMTDYALWEVILNGDSPLPTRTINGVETASNSSQIRNEDLKQISILDDLRRDGLEVANGNANNESKEISQEDRIGGGGGGCGFDYDWSDQAEEGPNNFALMAYTSAGSSSSSSSDTESQLNVRAYKACLESVEARLDVYKKNEAVFEEDIKILKHDIMLRDNALTELRKKFEKVEKERDYLKLTLEKFENSSKNLSKLLDNQVSDKFKAGIGYDSQLFDSQVNDKYKSGEGYHAVSPPYTRIFMPPNLIWYLLIRMNMFLVSK
ncbi:hypothetical protein Tco_0978148 [Tanacetum coccineum]|uniref:Uncharacterized protein n=1 Tax=Tanacetum coccineum TaxID=301880 RepID=A0ABQ5EM47_9ASTR